MSRTYSISKARTLVVAAASLFTSIYGQPLNAHIAPEIETEEPEIEYGSAEFFEKLVVIFGLVIIGGVFAGKSKHVDWK